MHEFRTLFDEHVYLMGLELKLCKCNLKELVHLIHFNLMPKKPYEQVFRYVSLNTAVHTQFSQNHAISRPNPLGNTESVV